ncbi:oligosaccharide flippase family protein [Aliivibrio fischeri]|uniref:oligosaccharide flippase family protein n=1 Tax=Aliivibrio fischeri TaxID=668 RepID=UPI0007C47E1A|nr:oligosaccharide flippase family protein [Aliivibrio fischeri]
MIKKVTLLGASRIIQFMTPMFVLPYIICVVGLESYGKYIYWLGLSTYLSNVVGLNIETYAIRRVAEDDNQVDAILNPILLKLVLASILILCWSLVSMYNAADAKEFILILFCLYPLLSVVLLPTHYFVGVGDFKLQLICSIIEKLTLLILVFLLVRTKDDYYLIPLTYSFSLIFSIAFCYINMSRNINMSNYKLNVSEIKKYFNVSKYLILGKLSQVHTTLAVFIIGNIFGFSSVGIFDVVNKVLNLSKVPLSVISQAVYSSMKSCLRRYIALFGLMTFFGIVFYLLVNYFSLEILSYLYSEPASTVSLELLSILSLVLISTPALMVFGTNYVARYGAPNTYGKLVLLTNVATISIFSGWYYSGNMQFLDFAWIVFFAETFLSSLCVITFIYMNFGYKRR